MKKIGIIGCGWLGEHLAEYFATKNSIFATTTSWAKKGNLERKGYDAVVKIFSEKEEVMDKFWNVLDVLDVIIITVPFPKKTDFNVLETRFSALRYFIKDYNRQLFLMSSIGIYPQRKFEVTEKTFVDSQLNSKLLYVEKLIQKDFEQVNILRLGGLMGGNRVFSNYVKPTTDIARIANHIHYEDVAGIIEKMINLNTKSKTYNVVAPVYPTKQEIINYQTKSTHQVKKSGQNRKVLSDLLRKDLNYVFRHPNPVYF